MTLHKKSKPSETDASKIIIEKQTKKPSLCEFDWKKDRLHFDVYIYIGSAQKFDT